MADNPQVDGSEFTGEMGDDFNAYHPGPQTFKVTSSQLNLKAPVISHIIGGIEGSKSITEVEQRMKQLGQTVTKLKTHKQIIAEIVPQKDNVCEVNLFSASRESKLMNYFEFGPEKPNSFFYGCKLLNRFNNFQSIHLNHLVGRGNGTNSLIFKINYPLAEDTWVLFRMNWKRKSLDQSLKCHSLTTKLEYAWAQPMSQKFFQFKVQNRANQSQHFDNPKLLETSHLYEAGFKAKYSPTDAMSWEVGSRLGVVPITSSYFNKIFGSLSHFSSNKLFGVRQMLRGGVSFGKNISINDLFQYKPLNRSQLFLNYRSELYLMNYPHLPLHPLAGNSPYTYISYYLSRDKKRENGRKHELEMGIGMKVFGLGEHSSLNMGFELRCLQFVKKRPVWAPKISIYFGEM